MPTLVAHAQAELLEPMNDVVEGLIKQNGEPNSTVSISVSPRAMARGALQRRQPDQGALLRIDLMDSTPASMCRHCSRR